MGKKPVQPLTHRQRLFVKEYLVDQNGTRAATVAGYVCKTQKCAAARASQLLKLTRVRLEIDRVLAPILAKAQFGAEEVLGEIRNLANADVSKCYDKNGQLLPLHEIPIEVRKAIAGIETVAMHRNGEVVGYIKKVKFWDKPKCLEMFGRHLKLFTDKVEASGPNGQPLTAVQQFVVVLPPKKDLPDA